MKSRSTTVIPIVLLVLFASIASFGQQPVVSEEQYAAPVSWTEYRIASQKLSIDFPKLPVVRNASDMCSENEGMAYHTYAAGVVYEFEWHAKAKAPAPEACSNKSKFSEATFANRLSDLKLTTETYIESEAEVGGIPAKLLRSTSPVASVVKTRWLIWQKDRWFEIGITRRKGTPVDEKRFTDGLKLSSSTGPDIGSGASSTLGDADVDLKSDLVGKVTAGLTIVTKPKPSYTDQARMTSTQGTVVIGSPFSGTAPLDQSL